MLTYRKLQLSGSRLWQFTNISDTLSWITEGNAGKERLCRGHDFLASEARRFEHDVRIIVLGSLEAGPK
jgi:hypothetical protein